MYVVKDGFEHRFVFCRCTDFSVGFYEHLCATVTFLLLKEVYLLILP